MLRDHRQIQVPEAQLERGLTGTDFPGEPVAIIEIDPHALARGVGAQLQHSFDQLDRLDFALLHLDSGVRAALVHHAGMPESETEIYVDRWVWSEKDILPDVLRALNVAPAEVSWRQEWPMSALG